MSKGKYTYKSAHIWSGKSVCNPAKKTRRKKSKSCMPSTVLSRLRALWNIRHPDAIIESKDPHVIWDILNKRLQSSCRNEQCWLRQAFVKGGIPANIESSIFAPQAPKSWLSNPHEWLSSLEINKVMKQYENEYPEFDFIGPTPIDFDKKVLGDYIWPELALFDVVKSLKLNKKRIGIIANTDPHNKPGEHWICMYIDLSPSDQNKVPYAFFMDSAGDPIPPELKSLYKRVRKQMKALGSDLEYHDHGNMVHQFDDNECGMYCIYVITSLLEGRITINDLQSKRIPDEAMFELRYSHFNYPNQE